MAHSEDVDPSALLDASGYSRMEASHLLRRLSSEGSVVDEADEDEELLAEELDVGVTRPDLASQKPGLGRHLGLTSTTLLIVSRMVGTGIFSTPSSITVSVGSVGAALSLWILGFFISFCGLFVWLEYGCLFPRSGGEKVYLEMAYPRPYMLATTLFAVQSILLDSTAGGCVIFAENIVLAFDGHTSNAGKRLIAILAIFCVSLMHSLVPRPGVRIMNSIAVVKIMILAFVVLTGIFILTFNVSTVPDPYASFRNPFQGSSHSMYDYVIALFKVIATYHGWSNAAYVLNEVKDPVRTLKIAGPLGLGIVGILYVFANIAYYTAATPEEIGNSGVTVAAFFLGRVFGGYAQQVAAAFVATSALGNVMTVAFSLSRVDQELAKEGVLPWSHIWKSNWPVGSPSAALLIVFLSTIFPIVSIPFGDAYNFLLDVMGYPTALFALFVTIGLFILRRREPSLQRPFKVWSPLAVIFLGTQILLIVTPFIRPASGKGDTSLPYWLAPIVSVVILGGGALAWLAWYIRLPKKI